MKLAILSILVVFLAFLSPTIVGAQKGWKTYTVDDKYSFQYPSNWKLTERENRFTPLDATITYGDTIAEMKIAGGDPNDTRTDDQMVESLKLAIEDNKDGRVFESGIDKQMTNNKTAPYVIGTWTTVSSLGTPVRVVELLTDVHLPDNKLVIVQYVARENDFDKYLPKAKQVINSISPIDTKG
jgi:hypothetical protein